MQKLIKPISNSESLNRLVQEGRSQQAGGRRKESLYSKLFQLDSYFRHAVLAAPSVQSPDLNQKGVLVDPSPTELASIYGGVSAETREAVPLHTIPETPANSQDGWTTATAQTTPSNTGNWSTSLQTVLDQPPSTLPQKLMLGGLVFCLAFGAWATFGTIDEVGRARGKLVPKGEVYKIHPIESGKIAAINVKEGQLVKAGQALVELNTEIARQEVERLEQMLVADKIQLTQMQSLIGRTRLEAQTRAAIANADAQAQNAAIAQANAKAAATREQLTQYQAMVVADQDRLERLNPLMDRAKELLNQRKADVTAQQERLERLKPLLEDGAIAKEQVYQAEQNLRDRQSAIIQGQLQEDTNTKEQLFQAKQNLLEHQSAITQNQGELQQTLAQTAQLQAELTEKQAEGRRTQIEAEQQIQKLEVEITQLKAKIAENQNLLTSAKAKLKQRFLYAPVDGIVSSLNIPNIGEVVQPGQTIAEMAPKDAPMILSASLPNQEAGFIKIGMPAQIKFDAYPYQDYGIVSGKVTSVSSDAKEQQLGTVYQLEVTLDRSHITANDQTIQFKAGQTASADIIIRRRRIADILLDPIRQLQKDGIKL